MAARIPSLCTTLLIACTLHAQTPGVDAKAEVQAFYTALANARSYSVKASVSMLQENGKPVTQPQRTEAYKSEERTLTVMPGRTALINGSNIVIVDRQSRTIFYQERKNEQDASSTVDPMKELTAALEQAKDRIRVLCSDASTITIRIANEDAGYTHADITLRRSDHLPTRIVYQLSDAAKEQSAGAQRIEVLYTELKVNGNVPADRFSETHFVQRNSKGEFIPAKAYEGYRIIRS